MNDAEQYVDLVEKRRLMGGASSTSDDQVSLRDEKENAHAEHEEKILTEDDVKLAQRGLPPQQYHAFVLYADEDVEFATELIERMESAGLKVSPAAVVLFYRGANLPSIITRLSVVREVA